MKLYETMHATVTQAAAAAEGNGWRITRTDYDPTRRLRIRLERGPSQRIYSYGCDQTLGASVVLLETSEPFTEPT